MEDEEIRIIEDEDEIEYVKMEEDTGSSKKSGGGIPIVPILAILLVVVALVLGGIVVVKTLTDRAKTDISKVRPMSAEYLVGRYVIRIYPTSEGNRDFMNEPIKIIHAKSDMINYINEQGESDILDSSFCDEYWMDYESYLKVKDLDLNKYNEWLAEVKE